MGSFFSLHQIPEFCDVCCLGSLKSIFMRPFAELIGFAIIWVLVRGATVRVLDFWLTQCFGSLACGYDSLYFLGLNLQRRICYDLFHMLSKFVWVRFIAWDMITQHCLRLVNNLSCSHAGTTSLDGGIGYITTLLRWIHLRDCLASLVIWLRFWLLLSLIRLLF